MVVRAFSIVILWLALVPSGVAHGAMTNTIDASPPGTPPPTEFNEFYPDERPLSDCLSSLPKPDCGSEARGGWRQLSVLGAVVVALAFIAWRIVRSARRTRPPVSGAAGEGGVVDEDQPARHDREPDRP